ncbi:MAG TPA: hypothetical protein VHZ74_08610 [Bryobacteraceae bacterium]|nr:hypothetical protein [Bryobacteraceae bacterium]
MSIQPISILFSAGFTIAVMWAMGRLLFRHAGIALYAGEHDLLAGVTGGAVLSLTVFILCAAGVARTAVFLGMACSALALYWRFARGNKRRRFPELPRFWKLLFAGLLAIYAVLYLSNSFAPEISPDGQTYHLGFVYRFFREHGFHRLTTNSFGNLSLGAEMLFLFAFSFGRNSAAATVHCCYLLALPLLIVSYARRIGKPRAGICAGLIVFLSPVVGIDGVSAYNDVALATTVFALFYLLEIWREEPGSDALLIPIGLLAGFCMAIKITGFMGFVYTVFVIATRRRPRALIPVAAAAAMVAVPWMIKDWLWLGNPVSPFLNRVFPNPYVHVLYEDQIREYFRHYELTGFRPWFWSVTMGGDLAGIIGPLFLLAPVAPFALRSRAGRHCLLAAAFFLVTYPQNIGARFLIPALPFLALGIAYAVESSRAALIGLTCAAAVAAWPGILPAQTWRIGNAPWRAALRIEPQDVYLRANSGLWVEAKMLDYFVPRGKRVWSTTPVGEAWANTDVMISYQSAEGELIEDMLTTAIRDDMAPTLNWRFTFSRRSIQHMQLLQKARAANMGNLWSIGEVRIFDGAQRISRAPSWKLDAKPFPWDIGLAFDGNPATRWRSWEAIYPEMHVDVDFGAPIEIDRVEVLGPHDEGYVKLRLNVCDGQCTDVGAKIEKVEDPAQDLRLPATRAAKARGIDYFLINDGNWLADDMKKDPARWGLEYIADRGGNKLYRLR